MNFPCKVYDTLGKSVIGIAYNSYDVLTLLVNNTAWSNMGIPYNVVDDEVIWFPKGGNTLNTIPKVVFDVNVTNQAITGTTQVYQLNVTDINSGQQATISDFPMSIIVNSGAGNVNLGNFNQPFEVVQGINGYLLGLNSPPVTTVTASLANYETLLAVVIINTNIATPISISVNTEVLSSSYLVYGANNKKNSTLGTEMSFDLSLNQQVQSLSAVDLGYLNNSILIGNTLLTAAGDTGIVYLYDMTNPTNPKLKGAIQLNSITSSPPTFVNFSGSPHYNNLPYYWSLYFVTDFNNGDPNAVYIIEGLTGSIWKININDSSIIGSFQDNKLIGKCPRVIISGILYFTQDGNLEQGTGQSSGVPAGSILVLDTTVSFNAGALAIVFLYAQNFIIAASLNNEGVICFIDAAGNLIVYDTSVNLVIQTDSVLALITTFANAKIYGSLMFVSIIGAGTKIINLATLEVTSFGNLYLSEGTTPNRDHYNFLPLNNNVGVLTFDNGAYQAGLAKYDLQGNFISLIFGAFNIYNIIPFSN